MSSDGKLDIRARYALGEKGAWLGISVNCGLFVFKMAAGVIGRSQAMVADAVHTASDVFTSLAVLLGFKLAKQPPDEHHPFGHGRAESIMAKLAAIALVCMGVVVAVRSVSALIDPEPQFPRNIALIAAFVSIIVKEVLYRKVIRTARQLESVSLEADAFHHRSDVFSSLAAIVGITAARLGWGFMDPLAGTLVSFLVVRAGVEMFHKAYDELMDAAPPEKVRQDIIATAESIDGVKEVTSVMCRKTGIEIFAELTIKINGSIEVREGHDITVKVEAALKKQVQNIVCVIIHTEPC